MSNWRGSRQKQDSGGGPSGGCGVWTLHERIDRGRGGHSRVYRVSREGDDQRYALKQLRYGAREAAHERFVREIQAYEKCRDIPGVLPLIDHYIPSERSRTDVPWMVVGYAEPIDVALGGEACLDEVVEAIACIALTLAEVHTRKISHRDIKPDNLFRYQGRWCVGDLGLVKIDELAPITAPGEKVGPIFYIAPEMLNNATDADGRAADVFSLAKTLWKLASGQNYPLPGEQRRAVSALTLSAYVRDPRAPLIDAVLEVATRIEPKERMSMAELAEELRAWLQPPILAAGSRPDLADLASALREVNRPHVLRQQVENERRATLEGHARRIRSALKPWARELEGLLQSAGMQTNLMLENFHWGFEIYGHQMMVEFAGRMVIIVTQDSRVKIQGSYVRPHQDGPALWQEERSFIAEGSRETIEVAGLVEAMKEQLAPALHAALRAIQGGGV